MMKKYTISVMMVLMSVNAVLADIFGTGVNQFTIDFVSITGDTNPASGYGIVHNDYRIGIYEITNDQWDKFKDSYGTVTGYPPGAYDTSSYYTGTDIPTNNTSWYEVAQFVNWLNTSTGHQAAYKFTGAQGQNDYTFAVWESGDSGYNAANPYRNSNAFYFLPTEDEWVKAAYWNGMSLQTYATKPSDTLYQGNGSNGGWNYYDGGYATDPYGPWDVSSGSEELNGTFDMMGNVWEFMESPYIIANYLLGSNRSLRGGSYEYFGGGEPYLRSTTRTYDGSPDLEYDYVGFRVASIPESTPPIANASGPYSVFVGDTLTLDGSGSTDPDDDIVSYLWDMDYDDIFETDAGGQAIFDVSYSYLQSLGLLVNYEYEIHLKVTDSQGQSDIAESTCIIIPKPATKVAVDIKPGSCPNPVNTKSSGVLPVAILGSNNLDVTMIDPASIRLAGVEPLRSGYEDVAAPAPDITDCNCIETGPDGLLDLTLKFATQAIVEAVGDVDDGDIVTLELTGILYDPIPHEIPIEGSDCILIKGKYKAHNKADINKDDIVNGFDFFIMASEWLADNTL
jgi:formylglycine-generating enzyme required for sulfatase activity